MGCAAPHGSILPFIEMSAKALDAETAFPQNSFSLEPRRKSCAASRYPLGIIFALVLINSMLPGANCALFVLFFDVRPGMILATVLLLALCGSIVYSLLQIVAALKYLAVRPPLLRSTEPISILKPLAGLDLNLESNLRTFFEQDYPAFEILFAVRSELDPAAEVVTRLQREYLKVPSRLVLTGEPPYPNAKVFSLDCMLAASSNDLLVMSDSDLRVTPDFLRTMAAEFQDAFLGVATCPYRATAGTSSPLSTLSQ